MGMRTVALLIACGIAASGCGQAAGTSAGPTEPAPVVRHVVVSGGTAAQRALVRRILAAMGPTAIRSVAISPTGRRWHPVRPGDVTMRVTTLARPRFIGAWQASLLGGAFRDLSAGAGLPRLTVLETPDGGVRLSPGRDLGHGVSAERLEQALRSGVRRTGAELVSLRIGHPDGPAALVVMRTDRPAWFLQHRFHLFFAPESEHAHGVAEVVVDGEGRMVAAGGNSIRVGEGWSWVRPDLAGCDPFVHSMPLGYSPPPCPAG
jgi:hypothetical protein